MKMGTKEVVKYYQSVMGTQVLPSLSPSVVMPVDAQSLAQLLVVPLCAMGLTPHLGTLLLHLTHINIVL